MTIINNKLNVINSVLVLFLLFGSVSTAYAQPQQRPVISQYMFSGLVVNPAYAGNQKQTVVTALHRDQWVNLAGAPKTQTLIVNSALKEYPIGVGLLISRDQIGSYNDYSVYSSYAYRIPVTNKGSLAMGLQVGFNYTSADFSDLRQLDDDDQVFNESLNRFKPNFGMGAFYSTKRSYAGVSVPYIFQSDIYSYAEIKDQVNLQKARYLLVAGGHVFTINDFIKMKPSTLLRVQQGQAFSADLNANVFLDDILNIGLSYRSGDSVIGLFELILNPSLSFGYSYDMTTSRVTSFTDGTHEFMLKYRRNLGKGPCHAYF
jgi:type IX secretion system PorP/SprF family membrane protein